MKNEKYERILVTGGAGFIGSHIVDKLIADCYDVTVIDNLITGCIDNVDHHRNKKNFHFINGDIRDFDIVKQALDGIDVVFHEAAIASVTRSVKNPIFSNDVNVGGTLNLLKASVEFGVKKFIFASSAAVYGDTNSPIKKENSCPAPTSPYGVSKLAAEKYVQVFNNTYKLATVCLRYFNVYGPRQNFNVDGSYGGAITIFINRLLRNMSPIIYGDGKQTRDFVFVKDLVEANMLAMNTENISREVFNIGTGKSTSLNKIVKVLKAALNKKNVNTIYSPPRTSDIKHGYADINKAKTCLHYNSNFSIDDGLNELVKWYIKKLQNA